MRKATFAALTTLPLALSLAACSSAPPPGVPEDLREATTRAATPRPEITAASEAAIARCMRDQGFAVADEPVESTPRYASMLGYVDLFSSPDEASAVGYPTTIDLSAPSALDTARAALAPPDQAAFDQARFGASGESASATLLNGMTISRSRGGCESEAAVKVFGSVDNALKVDAVRNDVLFLASGGTVEGALSSTMGEYEKCLSRAGVAVSGLHVSELAAKSFGAYRSPGDPPNSEESRIAASDATCQRSTRMEETGLEAFFDDNRDWLRESSPRLFEVAGIVTDASDRVHSGSTPAGSG